jgi:nucleotide-binding universal stress UspA family protein
MTCVVRNDDPRRTRLCPYSWGDDNHTASGHLSFQQAEHLLYFDEKSMKNILVPCDFSKPAEEAFRFAVNIAKQSHGEVHVLYVIDITFLHGNPTLANAYTFNVNFLKEIENESYEKFKAMWSRHAPMTMKVRFKHIVSSLVPEIENYIRENAIDLVVMGTRGEGNGTFGSNTDKVVRHAPVPVLSVRTCPNELKNIVLPVMDFKLDAVFVEAIKNLQSFFGAHLQILYINTPLFFRNDKDAMKDLEQFAKERFTNYSVYVRSDYTAETGIAHFVKEKQTDMVAMGTHAWKGLTHFFVGSISEDVINHLTLPIWTLCLK